MLAMPLAASQHVSWWMCVSVMAVCAVYLHIVMDPHPKDGAWATVLEFAEPEHIKASLMVRKVDPQSHPNALSGPGDV